MDAADKIKVDLITALEELLGHIEDAKNKADTSEKKDSCDTVKFLFYEITEEIKKHW